MLATLFRDKFEDEDTRKLYGLKAKELHYSYIKQAGENVLRPGEKFKSFDTILGILNNLKD
jgi:hypothetical protein